MKLKTVLVAPDKFKGSLTAELFCEIAKDEIKKFDKDIEVITCPLADGGEGSLDCFIKNLNAKTIQKKFTNANFERIDACYAIKDDVAFIECAETSGLLKTEFKNPLKTTTLGMGEQIFDAIKNGAKLIYLTLGGSATNDAGCGMAVGVGYKFFDENGNEFIPTGGTLYEIKKITFPQNIRNVKFIALCDVKNVLYGKTGAAFVYAKQKGATDDDIVLLDKNLQAFNSICKSYGHDFTFVEGAGAAGGLGAGAMFFLNAELKSGVETFFNLVDIESKIKRADLVITGEGKIDSQSKFGKVVYSLKEKCGSKNFVAFCGVNNSKENAFEIVSINDENLSLEENIKNTEINLRKNLQKYLKKYLKN